MTQPIPTPNRPTDSPSASSPILTPANTPPAPGFSDARLQQLLAGFDQAARGDKAGQGVSGGQGYFFGEGRRGSYSFGEHLPTPPPSRRPSFLSGFKPTFTPLTPAHPPSTPNSPRMQPQDRTRPSLSHAQTQMTQLPTPTEEKPQPMQRSKSVILPGKVGLEGTRGNKLGNEKRHFDPSKEPRLLLI
ncbi:hypothetical protein M231_06034 [Tremella mesenterica]|uniref:Uncharacterized protein n=1 Tax=Tremella mesenterica TaxID=5217 RepID=A0A4V1M3F9_TREME|nr:hypothetical protein M231_06034 [Tremella mesenterica]